MAAVEISALKNDPATVATLSDMLIEVVAHGASVSFMHPLARELAQAFWEDALARAARNERVVLGAHEGNELVGTVTLSLDLPPNQPHRAEITKLMTRVSHRGKGIAAALMRAAEQSAAERRRWLLVLDTAEDGGAAAFYEKLGFRLAGIIPDYALKPHGGLTATLIYWKSLG
jgi:ribosomal protein S18 acetylase RimI-like enzyme